MEGKKGEEEEKEGKHQRGQTYSEKSSAVRDEVKGRIAGLEGDFCSPVAKTLSSQCMGARFNPWSGS